MKFIKIGIVLFVVCLLFVNNSFANDYNFRKTKWGMTIEQVKASESSEIIDECVNKLLYQTKIIHQNMDILYTFVNNQLVRTSYVLNESHTNQNDFITDYTNLHNILTEKYGKPIIDDLDWKNNSFQSDFSQWGTAISIGHLTFHSIWETQNTDICIYLGGDNYHISCVITYVSNDLKKLTEEKEKEIVLNEF